MSDPDLVVMELVRAEAVHLAGIVQQFADLVEETDAGAPRTDDPALLRLVPDGYPDDADASAEFRALTQRDLLRRRSADAASILALLAEQDVIAGTDAPPATATDPVRVVLDRESAAAWLRTLAAVRLVLASRLGITDESDLDDEDPRYSIYEWLGARLDGLVAAVDGTAGH